MHGRQFHTATRPTSLNENARFAAAYGRIAVGHGVDLSAPRFSDHGVGAQWTACRVAAQSDGFRISESPDYLFGDDGVSGRAFSRPELERFLDTVRSGHAPFSRLYVADVARRS
ncbi:MAG: recombinase family protein [Gemmatimonadetes bacterium]|nr:recombinase family protein [Gemmatimonadota bacterium]